MARSAALHIGLPAGLHVSGLSAGGRPYEFRPAVRARPEHGHAPHLPADGARVSSLRFFGLRRGPELRRLRRENDPRPQDGMSHLLLLLATASCLAAARLSEPGQ